MGSQKSQTQRLYNNKARHPVGPIQSEVSGGPASSQPSRATLNIIPRAGEDHPHGKEMQKSKMAIWVGLTDSCEKKRSEKQRRKRKI